MAFNLKSGNSPSFKNIGGSPLRQEKHFLEKKKTIPMEGAKTKREKLKTRLADVSKLAKFRRGVSGDYNKLMEQK
jgi:hypothetical protein